MIFQYHCPPSIPVPEVADQICGDVTKVSFNIPARPLIRVQDWMCALTGFFLVNSVFKLAPLSPGVPNSWMCQSGGVQQFRGEAEGQDRTFSLLRNSVSAYHTPPQVFGSSVFKLSFLSGMICNPTSLLAPLGRGTFSEMVVCITSCTYHASCM